eukprot:scaffold3610_cov84-Amphora_coffeaeformis.AAC.1
MCFLKIRVTDPTLYCSRSSEMLASNNVETGGNEEEKTVETSLARALLACLRNALLIQRRNLLDRCHPASNAGRNVTVLA